MPTISFINQVSATARIPRAVICRTLAKAARRYGARLRHKHLSVVFMSAPDIRKLNANYRHKGRATNVLSFASQADGELGDIIICPAVASREAKAGGQGGTAYVNYLFSHGLLHLLGFDHKNNKEARLMAKATAELI